MTAVMVMIELIITFGAQNCKVAEVDPDFIAQHNSKNDCNYTVVRQNHN